MRRLSVRHGTGGFTLVELAVTLLVITILASLLLVPVSGREEARRRHDTEAMLAEIRDALIGFAIIHGRLPCPTRAADPASSKYGLEESAPCNFTEPGYLPWRSLGMAQHDAWGVERRNAADPWIGYWHYRVAPEFASGPVGIGTTTSTDLDVKDNLSSNSMVDQKMLVALVFSTGPNQTPDKENATFESGTNPVYSHGEPTTTFDDLLLWISRPTLLARLAEAGALK